MFEIDRLQISTKLENSTITEEKYYAIFGNIALELKKELLVVNPDEERDEDSAEIYRQHLIDARAVAIKDHLVELKKNMSSFMNKNTVIPQKEYSTFRYDKSKYDYDGFDEELINDYIKTAIYFLEIENIKNSMYKLDKLAYFKAQKLFWEEKINDELSKREEEELEKESNEKEE